MASAFQCNVLDFNDSSTMKFLFRSVVVGVWLLMGAGSLGIAQTVTTEENGVACPYPYAFFDPSKPQITQPKPAVATSPSVFGYLGSWGGWFPYSNGYVVPGGYVCGYTWSGYSYCDPVFSSASPCGNRLVIKIKF